MLMTALKTLIAIALNIIFFAGCADHRVDRSDEEAMMVYRECMSGMPPQINSADMSSTISNSSVANKNTSIAANVQTQQDQSQQIRCMQQAGWEGN